eukprot:907636-Pelagomonas_calceolata.AAC.1
MHETGEIVKLHPPVAYKGRGCMCMHCVPHARASPTGQKNHHPRASQTTAHGSQCAALPGCARTPRPKRKCSGKNK